jgi:hypothetical protein
MEEEGLVDAANHVGKREILVPEQWGGSKYAQPNGDPLDPEQFRHHLLDV